jgi:YegS/Rv2252/BmrU family lipid kinase
MGRMKVIFNPHADRGRAWDTASYLQSLIERHGGADWSATEYPRHATELAREAVRQGYDVVAALGGDGTVHEIVNGLMEAPDRGRPLLGVVPIGSGNDFCNNIGLSKEPEQAMHTLFHGTPRGVDIGKVTDGSGRNEYWDNTLGIGFDATVTIYSYKITRLQGFSMYLWAVIQTILRNHDAPAMTIETDQESLRQETLMLTVCNGPREGGGFHVAPGAVPDDGVLNYAMIAKVSRLMMFRLIPEVMNGTHGRFEQVHLGTCRTMKVASAKPVTIHTDGEIFAGFSSDVTQLSIDLMPKALRVIV